MTSPWQFVIGPQFDTETQDTTKRLQRELVAALKARDEKTVRTIADDLDEIKEILGRIRALVLGKHPDLLDLRVSKFTLPSPFKVRSITIGHWVGFFRIKEAPPPPEGWPLCILQAATPKQEIQARLRSYP